MRWLGFFAVASAMGSACGSTPEVSGSSEALTLSEVVSGLTPDSKSAIADSPFVPLLLPQSMLGARAMSGEHWFAETWSSEGITVSLHGTNIEHAGLPQAELAALPIENHAVRRAPARMTINEGIRSIAWRENGVAWALEVECRDVERDLRCGGEEFISSLADMLVTVEL